MQSRLEDRGEMINWHAGNSFFESTAILSASRQRRRILFLFTADVSSFVDAAVPTNKA